MLMLPYSTELRLEQRPYVVYAVILLCFIIFHFQQESRKEVNAFFDTFCQSIYEPNIKHEQYDYMRSDKESCSYYLQLMHEQADLDNWVEYNLELFKDKYTREELEKYASF